LEQASSERIDGHAEHTPSTGSDGHEQHDSLGAAGQGEPPGTREGHSQPVTPQLNRTNIDSHSTSNDIFKTLLAVLGDSDLLDNTPPYKLLRAQCERLLRDENIQNTLREWYGIAFTDMEPALTFRWRLHDVLHEFRTTTGYKGAPGEEWVRYLDTLALDDLLQALKSVDAIRGGAVDLGMDKGNNGDRRDWIKGDDSSIFISKFFHAATGPATQLYAPQHLARLIKAHNEKLLVWFDWVTEAGSSEDLYGDL
jgi:hypothetical protein